MASDGTGPALRRDESLPEHESVTVRRTKPKLAHAPRLISWRLQNLGTDGNGPPVERVNVVDTEVGDIAVIAELASGRDVGTSAEHECGTASAAEAPVTRIDIIDLTLEDVAVPSSGHVQIMNRENRIRADDRMTPLCPDQGSACSCGRAGLLGVIASAPESNSDADAAKAGDAYLWIPSCGATHSLPPTLPVSRRLSSQPATAALVAAGPKQRRAEWPPALSAAVGA